MKILLMFLFGTLALAAQVSYERIVKAASEPGSWLTYSGNYEGSRFSLLDQITPANVSRLQTRWVYQAQQNGEMESTPLVADGVVYFTEPESAVAALDISTGRPFWRWARPLPEGTLTIGFPRTNRGVAILDDTVFVGTLDAKLVALDAKSGIQRWETVVAENKLGYSLSVAPLAVRGKVIVGVSGAEAGIRGFVDAYDAKTGKQAWRAWTIPEPGEPGSETWSGDAWKTGGGSTWVTGAYDPELNLLYWGTGNPGPDWNGDVRPGDNLFTCSLLALDADTGKRRWHFQFTPHDVHDWDATHVPVLFDGTIRGKQRKLVAVANRNAFYYVLDRTSGEFLVGTPYAKQTWAKGLDDRGRPIVIPGTDPTLEGNLVWPSLNGATVWFSPAYSPLTRLFYVATRERGSVYYKGEAIYKPGTTFMGGGERSLPEDQSWGAIRALDVETGRKKWEFVLRSPPWAGVLATAGGLVFAGSNEGNFFALDAANGKPLWDFQTGATVRSNPIAFLIDGRQHVAIAAGKGLFVFGLGGERSD
jgi:alcohol dehydrogenase (cytochrome c)